MTLASSVPPKFDCELINDVSKTRIKELMSKYVMERLAMHGIHDSYIVFGMSKGSVIFVKVDKLEQVYARFSIHRQAITHIEEVYEHNKFVSICEEMNLNIWGFKEERA